MSLLIVLFKNIARCAGTSTLMTMLALSIAGCSDNDGVANDTAEKSGSKQVSTTDDRPLAADTLSDIVIDGVGIIRADADAVEPVDLNTGNLEPGSEEESSSWWKKLQVQLPEVDRIDPATGKARAPGLGRPQIAQLSNGDVHLLWSGVTGSKSSSRKGQRTARSMIYDAATKSWGEALHVTYDTPSHLDAHFGDPKLISLADQAAMTVLPQVDDEHYLLYRIWSGGKDIGALQYVPDSDSFIGEKIHYTADTEGNVYIIVVGNSLRVKRYDRQAGTWGPTRYVDDLTFNYGAYSSIMVRTNSTEAALFWHVLPQEEDDDIRSQKDIQFARVDLESATLKSQPVVIGTMTERTDKNYLQPFDAILRDDGTVSLVYATLEEERDPNKYIIANIHYLQLDKGSDVVARRDLWNGSTWIVEPQIAGDPLDSDGVIITWISVGHVETESPVDRRRNLMLWTITGDPLENDPMVLSPETINYYSAAHHSYTQWINGFGGYVHYYSDLHGGGLQRASIWEQATRSFHKLPGITPNARNIPAISKLKDGHLLFATTEGRIVVTDSSGAPIEASADAISVSAPVLAGSASHGRMSMRRFPPAIDDDETVPMPETDNWGHACDAPSCALATAVEGTEDAPIYLGEPPVSRSTMNGSFYDIDVDPGKSYIIASDIPDRRSRLRPPPFMYRACDPIQTVKVDLSSSIKHLHDYCRFTAENETYVFKTFSDKTDPFSMLVVEDRLDLPRLYADRRRNNNVLRFPGRGTPEHPIDIELDQEVSRVETVGRNYSHFRLEAPPHSSVRVFIPHSVGDVDLGIFKEGYEEGVLRSASLCDTAYQRVDNPQCDVVVPENGSLYIRVSGKGSSGAVFAIKAEGV